MDPPVDLEHLLGGMHDWRDVQAVIRTTFQALYDVAHAQSRTVREVERRLGEVQQELEAGLGHKASANELRTAVALVAEIRGSVELVSSRVEEEAQCTQDAQRSAAEEAQALRAGLGELRAALERHRTEVQQWRAGIEAGLGRMAMECAASARSVQADCLAALHQEVERWDGLLDARSIALSGEAGRLEGLLEDRAAALEAMLEKRASSLDSRLEMSRQVLQEEMLRLGTAFEGRVEGLEAGLREHRDVLEQRCDEFVAVLDDRTQGLDERLRSSIEHCSSRIEDLGGSLVSADARSESLSAEIDARLQELATMVEASQDAATRVAHSLEEASARLFSAVAEKASPEQLRDIVREAWSREESQIARLQRLCESKVSSSEFAALASLAEGKASMADVEAVALRHAQKRLAALVSEQQLVARAEVQSLTDAALVDLRMQLRGGERKAEELLRRQQRATAATDELRAELRALVASKLDRDEAEAVVAGALTDWVRAAQRGADSVQAALDAAGRPGGGDGHSSWSLGPVLAGSVGAALSAGAAGPSPLRAHEPLQVGIASPSFSSGVVHQHSPVHQPMQPMRPAAAAPGPRPMPQWPCSPMAPLAVHRDEAHRGPLREPAAVPLRSNSAAVLGSAGGGYLGGAGGSFRAPAAAKLDVEVVEFTWAPPAPAAPPPAGRGAAVHGRPRGSGGSGVACCAAGQPAPAVRHPSPAVRQRSADPRPRGGSKG